MLQLGVAKEQQPHYMRVLALPGHDPSALIRYGLALIGRHSGAGRTAEGGHHHGVMSCVRTYESPIERRFEEQGWRPSPRSPCSSRRRSCGSPSPSLVPAV